MAIRHPTVADGLTIDVECPQCGKQVKQTVAWLVDKNILPCDGCGQAIDLKAPDKRRRIEEVAREAARMQAALTRAGKLS